MEENKREWLKKWEENRTRLLGLKRGTQRRRKSKGKESLVPL
jgi:hypothetical protein